MRLFSAVQNVVGNAGAGGREQSRRVAPVLANQRPLQRAEIRKAHKRASNFENEDEHPEILKNNYVFTAVLVAPNA